MHRLFPHRDRAEPAKITVRQLAALGEQDAEAGKVTIGLEDLVAETEREHGIDDEGDPHHHAVEPVGGEIAGDQHAEDQRHIVRHRAITDLDRLIEEIGEFVIGHACPPAA